MLFPVPILTYYPDEKSCEGNTNKERYAYVVVFEMLNAYTPFFFSVPKVKLPTKYPLFLLAALVPIA